MKKRILSRIGVSLFLAAGVMTVAGCQPEPQPMPGQPLTWEQKHQLDLQEAQDMHDRRRQERPERPCHPGGCMD